MVRIGFMNVGIDNVTIIVGNDVFLRWVNGTH